jgi:hypothetical protein
VNDAEHTTSHSPRQVSPTLTEKDLEVFSGLHIGLEWIAAACIERVTDAEARKLGFSLDAHHAVSLAGLFFPYFDPLSKYERSKEHRVTSRLRRDKPEKVEGKEENKYLSPYSDNRHLYFAPGVDPTWLSDTSVPVVIVEAEKSVIALAAFAHRVGKRMLIIGTGGCWGWRGKVGVKEDSREPINGVLPDFDRIAWEKRKSCILFDANARTNPKVQQARRNLGGELTNRKAEVFSITLPDIPSVNGPDDFVGLTSDTAMLRLLEAAKPLSQPDAVAVEVPGVLASEVKPKNVRWLWRNHIPFGKLTLFDGDPAEGKSLTSLDLVARLTRGWTMPDGTEAGCGPAGAVVVSLEDGLEDTIRVRLEAAGADLAKVRVVQTITGTDGLQHTPTIPDDLLAIEAAILDVSAKLVVLDPVVATLGRETHYNNDQEMRRALAPLAVSADRLEVAVILVRHLNKSGLANAKYRGGGSIGIIGACRAAFLFANAPGEESVFVLAPVKGNLWRLKPPSMEYAIKESNTLIEGIDDPPPVVEWRGESPYKADVLLAQSSEQPEDVDALADAEDFLNELLKDGPKPAQNVMKEAKSNSIGPGTLKHAKLKLKIKSRRVGGKGAEGSWEWYISNNHCAG